MHCPCGSNPGQHRHLATTIHGPHSISDPRRVKAPQCLERACRTQTGMTASQPRVSIDFPSAGQWASAHHAEPALGLGLGATFSADILEQITNRHYPDGAPYVDMTPQRLRDIRAHLDSNDDFCHAGGRKAAEDSYEAEHG
jgi:hypothetical protein